MKQILYLGLNPAHYLADGQISHWPIIRIIPRLLTDPPVLQALTRFHSYTHLIITSKSTVFILEDYLRQLGIALQTWAEKITIAVGNITAKHLQACGISPARIAHEETAEGIIKELQQMNLENAHLFWPHSTLSRPLIKDFLLEQKIIFTACPFYETEPHAPGPLPDLKAFDEIVFTSPSTVEAFVKIFGPFPSHALLTPIGPVTAQRLEELLFLPN